MPFALVFVGIVLIVAAIRDTLPALFQQLRSDMPGFALWAAAIVAIGMLGYVPALRTPSRLLLALVAVVVLLKNGSGLVSQFGQALASLPQPVAAGSGATPGATVSTQSGAGGLGGILVLGQSFLPSAATGGAYMGGQPATNDNLAPMGMSISPSGELGLAGTGFSPVGSGTISPGLF